MEKELKQNLKIINSISGKYARKFNLDFQELQAQCFLFFVETFQKYNSERGKLSTYLFSSLQYRLLDYCIKEKEISTTELNLPIQKMYNQNFEKSIEFMDSVRSLSVQSQQIINFIFNPQKEFKNGLKITKSYLLKEFKSIGWPEKKIKAYFNEIACFLEKNN